MTKKFLIIYLLLVFIPLVAFIGWYSSRLIHDQRVTQRYEKQIVLEQSGKLLENNLLQSTFVHGILQSNTALLELLENNYYSASDELFAYNSQIKPNFTSILALESMLDEIFVYRYTDSNLSHSELVYYLMNVEEFSYPPSILEELKTENTAYYFALNPDELRWRKGGYDQANSFSPKLIYFMNLYSKNYSRVVGILEVQINLNKVLAHMDFAQENEKFYLKRQNQYYPITSTSSEISVATTPVAADMFEKKQIEQSLSFPIGGWKMDLVYFYQFDSSIQYSTMKNVIFVICFLLIPTFLFWLYINRFAAYLLAFSRHIRKSHESDLVSYNGKVSEDEFGLVVSEYNRLIKKVQILIKSVKEAEMLKSDANYYAMASQINPHFMFNTLENIRMHIEVEDYSDASNMLFVLSRFLRYNISLRRDSTLLDELEHIRNYLRIYQYRQKKKLDFQVSTPKEMKNIDCPFCILQPIVENCLKHGLLPSRCLNITITVCQDETDTRIEIADDGTGIPEEKLVLVNQQMKNGSAITDVCAEDSSPKENDGKGSVGLFNVNSRLKYFYGAEYGLSFRANKPHGVICTMTFSNIFRGQESE